MRYAPSRVPSALENLPPFLEAELARIANILAMHESGFWTPTVVGTTTAGAHTYSTRFGRYHAFDNKVFLDFRVILSAVDPAMAGNVLIQGTPFPQAATLTGLRHAIALISTGNVTFSTNYTQLNAAVQAISPYSIELVQQGSGVATLALPAAAIATGAELFGSITYERP